MPTKPTAATLKVTKPPTANRPPSPSTRAAIRRTLGLTSIGKPAKS